MAHPTFISNLDRAEQTINDALADHLAGKTITPDRMVDVAVAFGHVAKVIQQYGKALEEVPDSITPEEEKEATAYIQDLVDKSNALMETFDEFQQITIQAAAMHKIKELYHR